MTRSAMSPSSTEVDAYIFIKRKLEETGWITRNPERNPEGQVYTQNECLSNPRIKARLGLNRPENIVKITEKQLWVIEAKRSHKQLNQALHQARKYADKLNDGPFFKALIVSGVAGNNDDGFIVKTQLYKDEKWVSVQINGIEATALLSPEECETLLETQYHNIEDPPIDDRRFLLTAEKINKILHEGAVNPHHRANVVSALLLAMLSPKGPDIEQRNTSILIGDINTRVKNILQKQGKIGFYDHIRIAEPSATNNHVNFRRALVESLQELRGLNIHSAMKSGADWLGTFYEVFLKYARWAQDLGVVLTPRHITRFAARAMSITARDIVYDPTCGTGGFLVSAFEEVKKVSTTAQLKKFKKNAVFGLELDDGMAALAIVNMIFRGDGKNNIEQANCFSKYLRPDKQADAKTAKFSERPSKTPPVTRVLMNPPFGASLVKKGYEFVKYALEQMATRGLLFSILPYSEMVKQGEFKTWRKNLLQKHTLLAVITFPIDIFYPVSAPPVGIFILKGVPHDHQKNTLWIRADTDGHLKSKGKRLPHNDTTNRLEDCLPTLKAFLNDPDFSVKPKPKYIVATPIDFEDSHFELVPEVYLMQNKLSESDIVDGVDSVLRECAAFLVRNRITATWEEK